MTGEYSARRAELIAKLTQQTKYVRETQQDGDELAELEASRDALATAMEIIAFAEENGV